MHYRAQGVDFISSIGYAVSVDGLVWNRLENPVLTPHNGREDYRGVEDPRITSLDGQFYMCYIIQPTETWEIRGDVPNVIFSCTNIQVGDELRFYYAGADRLIGLATAPFADVVTFAQHGD
ncbi:MAG: hypothetical protein MUE54_07785 [Anaerolineae bacterium]|jgi:predicted GH43/DUF377 family glycosyl hydrolase|nr:hypothetical protein [Anaerolineae bacterium]